MTKKIFESFVDKVLDFPFWVKEVLYIKLREDFEAQSLSESDLHTPIEESYQLYTPLITLIGQTELEKRDNSEDEMVYRFLQGVAEGCSIAEITIKNFWTLADTARINIHSIQKEYVFGGRGYNRRNCGGRADFICDVAYPGFGSHICHGNDNNLIYCTALCSVFERTYKRIVLLRNIQ